MSAVFCDTSAFYAVAVPDDRAHDAAAKAWRSLLLDGHRLLTTNYVIVESVTLLQSRFGLDTAKRLHDAIRQNVEIYCVTPAQHEAAIESLFRLGKRKLSLVDCSSFTFMQHSRIATTFAYDPHFEEHGFQLYHPSEHQPDYGPER